MFKPRKLDRKLPEISTASKIKLVVIEAYRKDQFLTVPQFEATLLEKLKGFIGEITIKTTDYQNVEIIYKPTEIVSNISFINS